MKRCYNSGNVMCLLSLLTKSLQSLKQCLSGLDAPTYQLRPPPPQKADVMELSIICSKDITSFFLMLSEGLFVPF